MPRMRIPRLGNFHGALRVSSGTAALGPRPPPKNQKETSGELVFIFPHFTLVWMCRMTRRSTIVKACSVRLVVPVVSAVRI